MFRFWVADLQEKVKRMKYVYNLVNWEKTGMVIDWKYSEALALMLAEKTRQKAWPARERAGLQGLQGRRDSCCNREDISPPGMQPDQPAEPTSPFQFLQAKGE